MPLARREAPPGEAAGPREVRENRAGTQRATRLAIVYAAALLVLYGFLAVYARSAPGGATAGVTADLEIYALLAVLLAVAGAVLSLSSAPRRVELGADATVVVGRFGRRMAFGVGPGLDVRIVRRFPAGLLSSAPVEQVELGPKGKGRRRTFLIEAHLFDRATAPSA